MHCMLKQETFDAHNNDSHSFRKRRRRVWCMTCSNLIVLVLQELKARGQRPACAALMLRCAVVAPWNRHLGRPPPPFEAHKPPQPHPRIPTPSGWNNFLLANRAASGCISAAAADSGMCRHFTCVLVCYWPCIMHCCIPKMSQQNCLMIERLFQIYMYED